MLYLMVRSEGVGRSKHTCSTLWWGLKGSKHTCSTLWWGLKEWAGVAYMLYLMVRSEGVGRVSIHALPYGEV